MRSIMRAWCRRQCKRTGTLGESGAAALEFALLAPLLMLLLIGVADFGIGLWYNMEVQNATHAGLEYAAKYTAANGFDATAISNAVTSATPLPVNASPAPTEFCGCPTTSGVTTVSCTSTCSAGATPGTFVQVGSAATYTSIIKYSFIPGQFAMAAQGIVQIK